MSFYLKPEYAGNAYRACTATPENAYPRSPLQLSGRRFYSPSQSRWLNRDPMWERWALNLHGFLGNNAINWADLLGLHEVEKNGETEDCVWTLFLGHLKTNVKGSPSGMERLADWLKKRPEGGYPHSSCGDNKIGFGTCGPGYINKLVPPENRLPIDFPVIDPANPSPQEYRKLVEKAKELGLPPPTDPSQVPEISGGLHSDMALYNSLVEEAEKQCDKTDNCCRTIQIKVECQEGWSDSHDQTIQARQQAPDYFPPEYSASLFNPCTREKTIPCN